MSLLNIVWTNSFKKDYKRAEKQGKDIAKIDEVISQLSARKVLDFRYKDHKLHHNYTGKRECHLAPDWLLIYEITDCELILYGTGSHSYLFE